MTSRYTMTQLDRDGEAATLSVRGVTLTAGNITAQIALMAALRAAIEDVSLLVTSSEKVTAVENGYNPALPTHAFAERGIKFLVRGVDTLGNPQSFHISGAAKDLAGLMNGETMDLTSTEGAALESAINAFWVSNAGNAVVVQEIVYID